MNTIAGGLKKKGASSVLTGVQEKFSRTKKAQAVQYSNTG